MLPVGKCSSSKERSSGLAVAMLCGQIIFILILKGVIYAAAQTFTVSIVLTAHPTPVSFQDLSKAKVNP